MEYRDLIWEFTSEGSSTRREVMLAVFNSEQELFETRPEAVQRYPVYLPAQSMAAVKGMSQSAVPAQMLSAPELSGLGHGLWLNIPDEAKGQLTAATPDAPCRLKIASSSPAINDLPWEWLNDGSQPAFALRPEMRVVRSKPVRNPPPPLIIEGPLRVLLVVASPSDEGLLNAQAEIDAIRPRLDGSPYELSVMIAPTWQELVDAMKTQEPHILHYVGHAGIALGEGNLILQDAENRSHWICGQDVSLVLPVSVRLLCLSTCITVHNYQILGLSRFAHTATEYRLPTTIANLYPVGEAHVRRFWETFYDSLAVTRGQASEAFQAGQRAVVDLAPNDGDWSSFSMVVRDQSAELFRVALHSAPPNYAAQVQAQIASSLANDLAQHIASFDIDKMGFVKKAFEETAQRAIDLSEGKEA
jgi:hypothetical protein